MTLLSNCDTTIGWAFYECIGDIDVVDKQEGVGSIRIKSIAVQWWLYAYWSTSPRGKLTEDRLRVWIKPAKVSPEHTLTVLTSTGNLGFVAKFANQLVAGVWNSVDLDLLNPDDVSGAPDISKITGVNIVFRNWGAPADDEYKIDFLRIEPLVPPTPATLIISVNDATAGSTNPTPGTYNDVYIGDVIAVTALPNAGYALDHWEVDGVPVGSTNPYTITMDTDHTLTAVFAQIPISQYNLAIDSNPQGISFALEKIG